MCVCSMGNGGSVVVCVCGWVVVMRWWCVCDFSSSGGRVVVVNECGLDSNMVLVMVCVNVCDGVRSSGSSRGRMVVEF